jgi:hypothetical protein
MNSRHLLSLGEMAMKIKISALCFTLIALISAALACTNVKYDQIEAGEPVTFTLENQTNFSWYASVSPGTEYEVVVEPLDVNITNTNVSISILRSDNSVIESTGGEGANRITFRTDERSVIIHVYQITDAGIDYRGEFSMELREAR